MSKINWSKIMEDNKNKIIEKFIQAKRETKGCMQGWHVDIEMDETGDVWVTGLMSTGSQSMSSYKGETFIVGEVKSWEVELNESESIKYEEGINAEFEAQQEDENGYEYAYEFMAEKHPNILKEWEDNATEYEIDAFGDVIDGFVDRKITEEKEYEKYRITE